MRIKHSIFFGTAIAASFILPGLAKSSDPQTYQLIAVEDCEIVKVVPLSAQQTDAYLQLKQLENKMTALHVPIDTMQPRLDELTTEIEIVSQQAVIETTETLRIDKKLLEKQQQLAEQVELLVNAHQQDFDAIERQGEEISAVADKFTSLVEQDIDLDDFDFIHIEPTEQAEYFTPCETGKEVHRS